MLHPQLSALLSAVVTTGYGDLHTRPIAALRAAAHEPYAPAGPPVYTRELQIPAPHGALIARVYAPTQSAELQAGLIFFGAGFYVIDELSGHAALCQQLAVSADCVVVSVATRLSPEHKFPAAADDAYAATCWIHENADELGIDHRRLAIGGESTGASLATGVCRLAKERRNPALCFQLLLYPVTDFRREALARVSQLLNSDDSELRQLRRLTTGVLPQAAELYASSEAERADPRCSPLAASNLIGLPPALIINPELDALAEQVDAYGRALQVAQVPVTVSRYAGVGHGFVHAFAFLDPGREALAECGAALRTALHGAVPN
jgi:acetyl esterase